MVTTEREDSLRAAFVEAAAAKMNINDNEEGRELTTSDDVALDLEECYKVLFTDAEKEQYSYEYFLEDWRAYCERVDNDNAIHRECMTVSTALEFLKEMQ